MWGGGKGLEGVKGKIGEELERGNDSGRGRGMARQLGVRGVFKIEWGAEERGGDKRGSMRWRYTGMEDGTKRGRSGVWRRRSDEKGQ